MNTSILNDDMKFIYILAKYLQIKSLAMRVLVSGIAIPCPGCVYQLNKQ